MTKEEFYTAMLAELKNIKTIDQASSNYLNTIRGTFLSYEDDIDAIKHEQDEQSSNIASMVSDIEAIRVNTQTLTENILFGFYHSTGRLTPGSRSVRKTSGYLGGVIVNTNGVNDASIIVYDNNDNSGKVMYSVTVAGLDRQGGIYFGLCPVRFLIGCYIKLAGTGSKCYIYYR